MRVLALSAHTDDAELGAGGTLYRLAHRQGAEVHYAALSVPEPSAELRVEVEMAAEALQVSKLHLKGFEPRRFQAQRQEILDYLITLRDAIDPDLVIAPSLGDGHQDHQVVAAEAKRAFQWCSLIGYDHPWNNSTFTTTLYVGLDALDVEAKWEALQCYRSQRERRYFDREFVYGLAKVRGVQSHRTFAEAFEVVRWVM